MSISPLDCKLCGDRVLSVLAITSFLGLGTQWALSTCLLNERMTLPSEPGARVEIGLVFHSQSGDEEVEAPDGSVTHLRSSAGSGSARSGTMSV